MSPFCGLGPQFGALAQTQITVDYRHPGPVGGAPERIAVAAPSMVTIPVVAGTATAHPRTGRNRQSVSRRIASCHVYQQWFAFITWMYRLVLELPSCAAEMRYRR
jgi:hypothetical protein